MRLSAPTPTDDPLPLAGLHDDGPCVPPSGQPPFPQPSAEAMARFDALLHELNPDAPRIDALRLRALCAWLAALPPDAARGVLDGRLRRIEALRSILVDPDWDADVAQRARLRKLFDYLDLDEDLIPDREPLLGKLDDVLLIELAWPAFSIEAEEYGDFCDYRALAHPAGDGCARRQAWVRDRLAEIGLWRHRLRVQGSRYAADGPPDTLFHVV